MATIEEIDEITSLLKAINNVQADKDVVRIQTEILNREMETLSEMVKVQKEENEKKKEMLESLNGILNREKVQSAAISACKSTFARGSAESLLWFAKDQVKKSKLLQELKQAEVGKQIQKCIDDYADQDPKYRQLKEKKMQFDKLQDDLIKKREDIIRLEKFVTEEKAIEDMILRGQIIDLALIMVEYNNNYKAFPKTSESTSAAQHKSLTNEEEQRKSFERCTISAEPVDDVNDIFDFKMPTMRRAVKRKPIETSDEPARTVSSDEKFKFSTVAKEASKVPHRSILKSKEIKTTKMPSASTTMKQSQESDKFNIQKKNTNVSKNHDSNLSSEQAKPHMIDKQTSKTVTFVDFNSSIESDIVSLSGISPQKEPTSNSKSTSNIDIAMESPNDSDASNIKTNKENILKERPFDEDMELSSNASSIEENTPMSKSMEGTSKQANFEISSNFNFDLNFEDPFVQFTTPVKSKPGANTSTDATLDSNNDYRSFDLDFGRSPIDIRMSSTFQPTSDDAFNLINPSDGNDDFSSLFK